MSFKFNIKVDVTLNHASLEEELGKDYEFEEGKAYIDETLKEIFIEDAELKLNSLEITKIETSLGALYPVGVG